MSSDQHSNDAPPGSRLFADDDYTFEELVHEYTKLNRENVVRLTRRAAQLASEPRLRATVSKNWKTYRGVSRIELPVSRLERITVEEAIGRRHSLPCGERPRDSPSASGLTLSSRELGTLLGLTYGITHTRKGPAPGEERRLRATLSAGDLYPLEVYVLAFDVQQVPVGLYHYSVLDHCLDTIREGDMSKQFEATLVDGASAAGARAALVVTAVMQRTLFRYQHRGYRYVMNDVGAIMQSFSMVGAALGLETAGHGDFFDDELAALIGVNSVDEAVAMALIIRGGPGHVSMGYP